MSLSDHEQEMLNRIFANKVPRKATEFVEKVKLCYNRLGGSELPPATMAIAGAVAVGELPSLDTEDSGSDDFEPGEFEKEKEVVSNVEPVDWDSVKKHTPVVAIFNGKPRDGIYLEVSKLRPERVRVKIQGDSSQYREIPKEHVSLA